MEAGSEVCPIVPLRKDPLLDFSTLHPLRYHHCLHGSGRFLKPAGVGALEIGESTQKGPSDASVFPAPWGRRT